MTTKLVISALGADRPGIVDELSDIIYSHELNIEDSRMTVLGGEFAILLLISGELTALDTLQSELSEIEQTLQMDLLVKPTTKTDATGDTSITHDRWHTCCNKYWTITRGLHGLL
jgi:glycine cleavage system transcriptional repressor